LRGSGSAGEGEGIVGSHVGEASSVGSELHLNCGVYVYERIALMLVHCTLYTVQNPAHSVHYDAHYTVTCTCTHFTLYSTLYTVSVHCKIHFIHALDANKRK